MILSWKYGLPNKPLQLFSFSINLAFFVFIFTKGVVLGGLELTNRYLGSKLWDKLVHQRSFLVSFPFPLLFGLIYIGHHLIEQPVHPSPSWASLAFTSSSLFPSSPFSLPPFSDHGSGIYRGSTTHPPSWGNGQTASCMGGSSFILFIYLFTFI